MKQIAILIAVFLAHTLFANNIPSTVESVTVYPDGAQVTRESRSVDLVEGYQTVVFGELKPGIDFSSLQVKVDDAEVLILSVDHRRRHIREEIDEAQVAELRQQLKELRKAKVQRETRKKVVDQREEFLERNSSIRGERENMSMEQLSSIYEYYSSRIDELIFERLELQRSIDSLKAEIEFANKKLTEEERGRNTGTEFEILIEVEAERPIATTFGISYFIPGAGWKPEYHMQISNLVDKPVLLFNANVWQNSGEDWEDVELRLSSARPRHSSTVPELEPWYIKGQTRSAGKRGNPYANLSPDPSVTSVQGTIVDESGEPLIGVNVVIKGTTTGTITDLNGVYRLEVPSRHRGGQLVFSYLGYQSMEVPIYSQVISVHLKEKMQVLEEVVVTDRFAGLFNERPENDLSTLVLEAPTSNEYLLSGTYDFLSQSRPKRVSVDRFELNALYYYYAVPKLDRSAFLIAEITDWTDLNLMEGPIHIFFEGSMSSRSHFDPIVSSDTLMLSLGSDDEVVVDRKMDKKKTRYHFLNNRKTITGRWTIGVANHRSHAIDIVIEDQYPLAADNRVDIDLLKNDADRVDEEQGLLRWELTLPAGQSQELEFGYEIKLPEETDVRVGG